MLKWQVRFLAVFVLILTAFQIAGAAGAETWRLEKGKDWKAVTGQGNDKYFSDVAEIKRLVNMGKASDAEKKLAQLKKDFPEIAGRDLDAFMKGEMLFARGKFVKAVRKYDKFLAKYPESELYGAALDREYAIATAFLAGEKKTVLGIFRIRGYDEGEKIMEKISDRAGDAPIAERALLAVARSYEKRTKFNEASGKWSEVSYRWPTGEAGKEALLGMARCKHAAYKGPGYDSSSLVSAKSYYEDFKQRYPADAEKIDIDGKLKQIVEQLAYKQFSIGRYYQRTGSVQPANSYYQMVLDNWPGSTAAKMVKQEKQ
jgi:outer membrane protein assembly factor BamD (BamD/ComL family)